MQRLGGAFSGRRLLRFLHRQHVVVKGCTGASLPRRLSSPRLTFSFSCRSRTPARTHTHHPVPEHKHHSIVKLQLTLCQMADQTAYRGWRREDECSQLSQWDPKIKHQTPWWQIAVACFVARHEMLAVTQVYAYGAMAMPAAGVAAALAELLNELLSPAQP